MKAFRLLFWLRWRLGMNVTTVQGRWTSVAIIAALLLALATNIGVGGMVEGFRRTFTGWLDERLVAEIYYEAATPADAWP